MSATGSISFRREPEDRIQTKPEGKRKKRLLFAFYLFGFCFYTQRMVARLTVIFIIFLSLEVGIALTLLPWISFGVLGDWGNNYLLAYVANQTNLPMLQTAVASGWARGAVTGLGVLNLFIAFWELAHFNQSVKMLESKNETRAGDKP
jgi:hypothetical protein